MARGLCSCVKVEKKALWNLVEAPEVDVCVLRGQHLLRSCVTPRTCGVHVYPLMHLRSVERSGTGCPHTDISALCLRPEHETCGQHLTKGGRTKRPVPELARIRLGPPLSAHIVAPVASPLLSPLRRGQDGQGSSTRKITLATHPFQHVKNKNCLGRVNAQGGAARVGATLEEIHDMKMERERSGVYW